MAGLQFVWDEAKAATNRRKHGVSFEEARTVFFDDYALFLADPEHSEDEDRILLLGLSVRLRLIVVCHCFRGRCSLPDPDHLYLRDCASVRLRPSLQWTAETSQ